MHQLKRKTSVLIIARSWPSPIGKYVWHDPGLKADLMKRDLELLGENIKSIYIFVWFWYVRQKESISATWMSKLYPTIKLVGEL